jgi:spore coat polysaccharide biosynthesis protein SpsF (cytidylyltransferase family)
MVIYLKHPIHGAKVATMELEAEADEKNGWVRYTLDTPNDFELAAPVNVLEVKRRRKVELEGI